jgi:hypothetical protein
MTELQNYNDTGIEVQLTQKKSHKHVEKIKGFHYKRTFLIYTWFQGIFYWPRGTKFKALN